MDSRPPPLPLRIVPTGMLVHLRRQSRMPGTSCVSSRVCSAKRVIAARPPLSLRCAVRLRRPSAPSATGRAHLSAVAVSPSRPQLRSLSRRGTCSLQRCCVPRAFRSAAAAAAAAARRVLHTPFLRTQGRWPSPLPAMIRTTFAGARCGRASMSSATAAYSAV